MLDTCVERIVNVIKYLRKQIFNTEMVSGTKTLALEFKKTSDAYTYNLNHKLSLRDNSELRLSEKLSEDDIFFTSAQVIIVTRHFQLFWCQQYLFWGKKCTHICVYSTSHSNVSFTAHLHRTELNYLLAGNFAISQMSSSSDVSMYV